MSEPRKHHYLPQFYLRGFSADGRRIWRTDRDTGSCVPVNIKDTAAIRDYNEIDFKGAPDANAAEKLLGQMESELATDLAKLLRDGVTAKQELCEVICLLAQLRLRIPAFKRHVMETVEELVRQTARALERQGRLPEVPPGLERVLSPDSFDIEVKNWYWLSMMLEISSSSDALEVYSRMRVQLLRSKGTKFVTSDQPVTLYYPEPEALGWLGVGPATPGVEVCLPLSSSSALLLDHGTTGQIERMATDAEVWEMNRRQMVASDSMLLSESALSEDFLERLSAERAKSSGFSFGTMRPGGQMYQVHRFVPVGP